MLFQSDIFRAHRILGEKCILKINRERDDVCVRDVYFRLRGNMLEEEGA